MDQAMRRSHGALTTCLVLILAAHPVYSSVFCFLSDRDYTPSLSETILGANVEPVILVRGLEAGSSAELIGLESGDLIVGFDAIGLWGYGSDQAIGFPGHYSWSMRFYRHIPAFNSALAERLGKPHERLKIMRYDRGSDRYLTHQLDLRIKAPIGTKMGILGSLAYLVVGTWPGGAGQSLGLKAGDFVEQVDGHPFTSAGHLDRLLESSQRSPDRRISLLLTRWFPVGDGTLGRKDTRQLEGYLPAAAPRPRPMALRSLGQLLQAGGMPVLRIVSLAEAKPAVGFGLEAEDLIVRFNNQGIGDFQTYQGFLDGLRGMVFPEGASVDVLRYDQNVLRYVGRRLFMRLEAKPADSQLPYLGIKANPAFLIDEVCPGTAAKRLGFRPGDLVDEIQGGQFDSVAELEWLTDYKAPNCECFPNSFTFGVYRWVPQENDELELKFTTVQGYLW
jgi:hypothetical protein